MDLLSAVAHELGHVRGLDHSAQHQDVMSDRLLPEVRRMPAGGEHHDYY